MNLDTNALGAIEIRDLDGNPVHVRQAWANGPALFVFLRHFG